MEAVEFGAYLKTLRKSKKLTVRGLAQKSEVAQSYITNVENGNRGVPSASIIRKLSAALGCTHIGMMIKAGHITESEVFGFIDQEKVRNSS